MRKATKIAIAAATEAGGLLRSQFFARSGYGVTYKKFKEPVSLVDYASNDIIIRHISRAFPRHRILSEESEEALDATIGKEPTWIIDPLDGTSNFIAGIPIFGLSVVLVENRIPQVGLIYDPTHNEMFVAERGKGTKLNGKKIFVSDRDVVKGAMLFAGRGYRQDDRFRHGKVIYALEKQTTYFRRLGSATVMLASVAAGRADSVILTGNKPWDTVAGVLLVEEAGGRVTDYCGKKWTISRPDVVATNGDIHSKIISITKTVASLCR